MDVAHEEGGVMSPSSPVFKLRNCSMVLLGAGHAVPERAGGIGGV